jgi:hypothetical protein
MRSLLVFGLLIAVFASTTSAHARSRHHHHGNSGYRSSYGSYIGYGSYGYGSYGGSYGGSFSGHNSSQWGGQPD